MSSLCGGGQAHEEMYPESRRPSVDEALVPDDGLIDARMVNRLSRA